MYKLLYKFPKERTFYKLTVDCRLLFNMWISEDRGFTSWQSESWTKTPEPLWGTDHKDSSAPEDDTSLKLILFVNLWLCRAVKFHIP
jgi:hypothetical protein